MNKFLVRWSLLGLLTVAVVGAPAMVRAQNTTNAPAKTIHRFLPFHGRIKAIDKTNKTVSVGNEVFQVTSETKITKENKPATLEDGTVGEEIAGTYRKEADGKLNALSLRIGPKPAAPSNTKTNAP